MPQVAIIIPVFNKEKVITETLNSVFNQRFKDWECILVDDGSTDKSLEIINRFINDKPQFKLYRRPQQNLKGASSCRNLGLQRTDTPYVQFLDADDLISENKLEKQMESFNSDPHVDLLTCEWGRLTGSKREIYKNFPSYKDFDNIPKFLNSLPGSRGYFPLHAYLIKRNIIEKAGPWNEKISLNDDGEFMLRVISNCQIIKFVPSAAVWYRYSDGTTLSRITNFEVIDNSIYGRKMTESYLNLYFGKDADDYIEWTKNQKYVYLKVTAPHLLRKHREFFKKQINRMTIYGKVKNKIKEIRTSLS